MEYKISKLSNGIKVIMNRNIHNTTATIAIMVNAGSNWETKELNGIAHFLEHLFFKGTKKRPSQLILSQEFDHYGAVTNAFTDHEMTCYYAKVSSDHLDPIVEIMSDVLINSIYNQEDINKERSVVINEINQRSSMPNVKISKFFNEKFFKLLPIAKSVIGTEDNIKKINSPSVNKNVLRNRVLIGNYTYEYLPISNNVYTDLHPVFYIFGLLLPYVSRILQVDMYGMFEQLANLSENRQLNENELKLIKMTSMNDVKILDLDDTPLTYEQQVNVLIYLNMFLHVVTNSLFKLDRESLPKMIEQTLINQFNSIIETKYKLNSIYDKLHSNDPYHVKVLRKVMLSFGIRPVKLKLKNVPSNVKGMISSINICCPF